MNYSDVRKVYRRAEELDLLNPSIKIQMIRYDNSEEWVSFRGFRHDALGNPDVVWARSDDPYRCEVGHITMFPALLPKR